MAERKNNATRKNRKMMYGGAMATIGSKAQVFHGSAHHTSGGLSKKDLMKTKAGRIVSRKKHAAGLKAIKKLKKMGFVAKKGTFKLFKKMRGGADMGAESASASSASKSASSASM
jgi:hypothetical protein